MSQETRTPKNLLEVVTTFADESVAFKAMAYRRWPNGVVCPHCQSDRVRLMEKRRVWNCNGCRKQFSVKTGTIFEDSPISFSKWLPAMWLIANAKNGISSCELARSLSVTQKTAWFMLHRIRLAMETGSFEKLSGSVEADETYVGGKAGNMHRKRRDAIGLKNMIGGAGKTIVFGMLERGGKVVTRVIEVPNRKTFERHLTKHVDGYSKLYTDSHRGYDNMGFYFQHFTVDHAVEYVKGHVHTNGMENYWSLLKRTLKGTYISVDPWHLHRYCEEQAFRFNVRKMNDGERFETLAQAVTGRRLTYRELTGKEYLPIQ